MLNSAVFQIIYRFTGMPIRPNKDFTGVYIDGGKIDNKGFRV